MSRRSKPAKRIPAPDPIYNSVDIAKFINRLMKKGKKSVAQRILYTTMEQVQQKTKSEPIETFKKALTNREQLVFDHFLENKNTIVYARDLAKILELPRDYVYKYIKNLRSKLNEDVLQNADNGGYLLKV